MVKKVNQVVINGETVIDLTRDTVTADALLEGVSAHNAAGEQITGQLKLGAYDITATDNEDGSQNLIITDAAGSGGSSGSKTVNFSEVGEMVLVTITYVSNGTMKCINIGMSQATQSAEITVDVNTTIYITTTRPLTAFYPTVSGATLLPGAIVERGEKDVFVSAMYKID